MLHLDALRSAVLEREPYEWATLPEVITPADAALLEAQFPTTGFVTHERLAGSDKTYRIAINTLVAAEGAQTWDPSALGPAWSRLVQELLTDEYRATMSELTAVDLSTAVLSLTLNQYDRSFWLAPHTDKYPKLVTQLIYFSGEWRPSWGGALQIFRGVGDSGYELEREVTPRTGVSVLIVRSKRSWHAVAPVLSEAPTARRSLQITFWAHAPAAPLPGRRELYE
jgi:hypothetical protein